jgi:hypothetical protein
MYKLFSSLNALVYSTVSSGTETWLSFIDSSVSCVRVHAAMVKLRFILLSKPIFFFFGATVPIWALAYVHETLRFTSVGLLGRVIS